MAGLSSRFLGFFFSSPLSSSRAFSSGNLSSGSSTSSFAVHSLTCFWSLRASALNGLIPPDSSSYSTTPKLKKSDRRPYISPASTSGAQYPGVPLAPLSVLPLRFMRAMPISTIIRLPSRSNMTFSGLRSRYTIFLSCSAISPSMICAP